MSLKTRSYYLQQLGLPNWQQRLSLGVMPYESVLPNNAKLLFVLHFPCRIEPALNEFLIKIAQALGIVTKDVAYAFFNFSIKAKANLSPLLPLLSNAETLVLVFDFNTIQSDINAMSVQAHALTLHESFNWQSHSGKKKIMNWLLSIDVLL